METQGSSALVESVLVQTDGAATGFMDRTTDLLQYLRQEPEEVEWATAGPKRDKSHENRIANSTAKEAQKPLALLEQYCTEGKISHGHIDDRQGLLTPTNWQHDLFLHKVCVCAAEVCLHHAQTSSTSPKLPVLV